MNVRYDNGTGANSSHTVSVNGGGGTTLTYPATYDWGRYRWVQQNVTLVAGANTIRFTKATSFAELDAIHLYRSTATDPQFQVVNRNSGKLLEISSALTTDGAAAGQWGPTANATQRWNVHTVSGSTVQLFNVNSGKLLEIPGASTADGADAGQWGPTGSATQNWVAATSGGWWTLQNANSSKVLEITGSSSADGAIAQQNPSNGCACQQWRLVKEGIQ
jgi:hypothetical protein